MNSQLLVILSGIVMILVQVVAALPWLALLFWQDIQRVFRSGKAAPAQAGATGALAAPAVTGAALQRSRSTLFSMLGVAVGIALIGGGIFGAVLLAIHDPETNALIGRVYGSLLHLQLGVDLLIGVFAGMLIVWPKGGAVALSAFREGVRQLTFLILLAFGLVLILASVVIPYFTFGEDYKMMQELGYETIMLVAALFGCLTASTSISEEIEGRTAVTLMSKPVSRRQFLLGKFVGLFLVCLLITLVLGWWFDWMLLLKRGFDKVDPVAPPPLLTETLKGWTLPGVVDCLRGVGLWAQDAGMTLPGLFLGSVQTMILLALAVSLATRLPMAVNLTACLGLYLLGHLTPVLVQLAVYRDRAFPSDAVSKMLLFMTNLFDALLPSLEFFNLGPAVVRDPPPPLGPFLIYVGSVGLYGLMYTMILLILGLVLFEDRDLA
jgi:ABC-type transport system involved in multi-copper enzyme maturation permease subunit